MFGAGHLPELIVIAVVIILLFGGSRIGGLGKGIGQFIHELRSVTKNEEADAQKPPAAK